MTYPNIEKISTPRFPEVDLMSMGPTWHKSFENADEYVKNNIDYIAPDDVKNILIINLTWHSDLPESMINDLMSGKAPYDYILMYNLFDGWTDIYNLYYQKIKEHYKVNIIGPQKLEPENFFNFHEYNVASWTNNYHDHFLHNFNRLCDPDVQHGASREVFFYYGGAISDERLQFVNELWTSFGESANQGQWTITLGIQGGMQDGDECHYPDGFGDLVPWKNSIVNIVSETRNGTVLTNNYPGCFVTEKTFKPIFAYMPFIHINQSKIFTEFLTNSCGYRLYNSFFGLPNHDVSNEQVIAALLRVIDMSRNDRTSLYHTMIPTIKHNYQNLQKRAGRIHNMFRNRNA